MFWCCNICYMRPAGAPPIFSIYNDALPVVQMLLNRLNAGSKAVVAGLKARSTRAQFSKRPMQRLR